MDADSRMRTYNNAEGKQTMQLDLVQRKLLAIFFKPLRAPYLACPELDDVHTC